MNTVLTPARLLDSHQQSALAELDTYQRASLMDRLSLRLGLWLLLRGTRRIQRRVTHEEQIRQVTAARVLEARERAAEDARSARYLRS
ncbi:hypothetical protein ACTU3I_16750 [Microbacterium sp. RD1]|uniref:hypothetical protein n=1 Tax=Microbacterium sp. RD1 TaxID=3457313 RepID=UPI003FA5380B